jgi:hypothetical protein
MTPVLHNHREVGRVGRVGGRSTAAGNAGFKGRRNRSQSKYFK